MSIVNSIQGPDRIVDFFVKDKKVKKLPKFQAAFSCISQII